MSQHVRFWAVACLLALLISGCAKKEKKETATVVTTPVAPAQQPPAAVAVRPPDVIVVPAPAADGPQVGAGAQPAAANPNPAAAAPPPAVVEAAPVVNAAVAGAPANDLKYRFKPGERYIYAVTITADLPDSIDTYKGQIELAVKSADDNHFTMVPSANLPKDSKLKKPVQQPIGPPRIRGPTFPTMPPPREWTLDTYGKVLKATGEQPLSLLLGDAALLTIEPLPRDGAVRWQAGGDTLIREGKADQGGGSPFAPGGFWPRMPTPPGIGGPGGLPPAAPAPARNDTVTTAREATTYQITDSKNGLVHIKKDYDLKMLTATPNAPPRLQMQGAADLVFDLQAGVMKSCAYQPVITVSLENIQVRVPMTVSYRLLDAKEMATLKKEEQDRQAAAEKSRQDQIAAAAAGEDTAFAGQATQLPRRRMVQPGKAMLGVDYRNGSWEAEPCLAGVSPVYDEKAPPPGYGAQRVLAKPGYAVGAVNVRTKRFVSAIQLVFMKLGTDGQLDPKDSYTSAWLGHEKVGTTETKLGGDGRLVIGVSCQQGAIVNSMALVMDKKK